MKITFEKLLARSNYKNSFLKNKILPKSLYNWPLCKVNVNEFYKKNSKIKIDNDTWKRPKKAYDQLLPLNYNTNETFDFSLVTPKQNKKIWNWLQGWILKNPICVIHNQKPGQCHPFHMDLIYSYIKQAPTYHGIKIKKFGNQSKILKFLQKKIKRVFIFLEDWHPGQVVMIGTKVISNWSKGDVLYFDWYHVPHGTANFSRNNRMLLQVTGETTPEFEKLIKS